MRSSVCANVVYTEEARSYGTFTYLQTTISLSANQVHSQYPKAHVRNCFDIIHNMYDVEAVYIILLKYLYAHDLECLIVTL